VNLREHTESGMWRRPGMLLPPPLPKMPTSKRSLRLVAVLGGAAFGLLVTLAVWYSIEHATIFVCSLRMLQVRRVGPQTIQITCEAKR